MKAIKKISIAVLGIYYLLFITRIVLPQLVQIDVSWAIGLFFSIILFYASPLAVLAIILICTSLYLSYKRETIKPRVIFVIVLLALSILPTIATVQFVKMIIQSKQYSGQVSKIEKIKVDLGKKLVGSIALNAVPGERIKEFQVRDNYVYALSVVDTFNSAFSSYLNVIDISNPSAPFNKGRISLSSDRTARMMYSDDKIYIFDTKNTFTVDVSNKETLKIISNLQVPDDVVLTSFFKDDEYLYTVNSMKELGGGSYLSIFEIASNWQSWWKFDLKENYPRDMYARGGYLYSFFTEGKPTFGVSKLSVIDTTNLKNIREVKTIDINSDTNSLARKIVVSGNYMYLQSEVRTYKPLSTATLITVLDISDVNNISEVGKLEIKEPSFPGGFDISISGNYLFFENKIINILDPRNPVIEKELTGFAFPSESVLGGYYYNLVRNQDADNIDIYNLIDILGQK